MRKFKLFPVILILVTTLLIGCSDDDNKKSSITEFNYMDKEQNDYVLFIRNNGQDDRSSNQLCLAVIKENGYLDEAYLNYDGVQYELQNLATGRVWSCEELKYLAGLEGETVNLSITGYLEDILVLQQDFSLEIVNFTTACNWPETVCEEVVEESGYTHFVAIDADVSWSLNDDNEYQTIWINQPEYYNLKTEHKDLKSSCRGCCLEACCFSRNPEESTMTLIQMNTFQEERFLAISMQEVSKDYGESVTEEPAVFSQIDKILKTIR